MQIEKDGIKKLNLGAGKDIRYGFDNHDIAKLPGMGLVFDLNKFPYPIKNNIYDYILANHCIMYILHLDKFFNEIHRIAKPNAIIDIVCPHISANFCNVFSYHYFSIGTLNELEGLSSGFHKVKNFKILERKIIFREARYLGFFMKTISRMITTFFNLNKKMQFIADRLVSKYMPFYSVSYKLKVVK